MNARRLRNSLSMMTTGLVLMNTAWAGAPVWTFAPVSGYPASVSVSPSGAATIKYTVTNQSHKSHTLKMRPIQGITSSGCASPLGYHQSCTLILTVAGSGLKGDVLGGPILCEQGNPNQCYQPSQANSLTIRLTQTPPVQQYTITSSAGSNGSVSPSGSQTVNSGTTRTFTATPDTGYGVNQWLVDGNPAQTGGTTYQLTHVTANHTVNVTFGTVTLTPSVSTLGLSVSCPAASLSPDCAQKNDALTGNPRKITITNTGSGDATNVVVSPSGLPSDASVSPSNCGTITANGGTCEITVTPGAIASANASSALCTTGAQPEGSVNVTADGGLSASVDTYVLSYGCIYQGGFIYSVDDTTANTGSIGGKVSSLADQAAPYINSGSQATSIIWSSNGNGSASSDVSYTTILGIDKTSTTTVPSPTFPPYPSGTPVYTECNGASDGACDSGNILSYYNFNRTSGGSAPTPLGYYAAGLCKATINTYSDWYLPSICEMDAVNTNVTCPTGAQSMLGGLSFLLGDPGAATPSTSCTPPSGTDCLAGYYWSSTEDSDFPQYYAYIESFSTGGSLQYLSFKNFQVGVRCSRALTL
ncbi:MAG: hypothetical protein QM652_04810 [Legionella sp.]|uniref:InlB B-repeat-containing protein n=1 Tax=Legionella sp. TaxID=459 RepID=UPI0039E561BC